LELKRTNETVTACGKLGKIGKEYATLRNYTKICLGYYGKPKSISVRTYSLRYRTEYDFCRI
jgi:hypothetical protein